jgi:flagellar basal-body rod protein FlgB
MSTNLDSVLGDHAAALSIRARRAELLASNLANADTPAYKAKDVDFQAVLKRQQGNASAASLTVTNAAHLSNTSPGGVTATDVRYRIPNQPSLDGNTVDPHLEKAAFAENAVQYQTTLTLLNARIRGLMTALRGD